MIEPNIEREQQRRKDRLFAQERLSLIESIQKKIKEMEKEPRNEDIGFIVDENYNSALSDINNYLEQLK